MSLALQHMTMNLLRKWELTDEEAAALCGTAACNDAWNAMDINRCAMLLAIHANLRMQ